MIEVGDIHRADLNDEVRRHVLVVSRAQFNSVANRVLVAPEILGGPDPVPLPWRVTIDDRTFAVDLLRSLPTDRILERVDRAPAPAMAAARRAVMNIV